MSTEGFPEVVPSVFVDALGRRGFAVSLADVSPADFGNAFCVLCSGDFCIRFVRDRGDMYIEVQSRHSLDWYSLNLMRSMLMHRPVAEDASVDALGLFFDEHYGDISILLSPPRLFDFASEYELSRRKRIKDKFPG